MVGDGMNWLSGRDCVMESRFEKGIHLFTHPSIHPSTSFILPPIHPSIHSQLSREEVRLQALPKEKGQRAAGMDTVSCVCCVVFVCDCPSPLKWQWQLL